MIAEEDQARGHRHRAPRSASTRQHKPGVSNLLVDPRRGHRRATSRRLAADFAGQGYGALKTARRPTPWSPSPSRSPSALAELLDDSGRARPHPRRAAPSGPTRWLPRPSPTAYERVGFLRPVAAAPELTDVSAVELVGRRDRDPAAARERAHRLATPGRRPGRRPGLAARDPAAADAGRATTSWTSVETAPGRGGRARPGRSRCTWPAPGRSGRFRRWCSSRWLAGSADCETARGGDPQRPARPRPRLPVPPARDRRPGHRRRRRSTTPTRGWPASSPGSRSTASCCSPATPDQRWHWRRSTSSVAGEPAGRSRYHRTVSERSPGGVSGLKSRAGQRWRGPEGPPALGTSRGGGVAAASAQQRQPVRRGDHLLQLPGAVPADAARRLGRRVRPARAPGGRCRPVRQHHRERARRSSARR